MKILKKNVVLNPNENINIDKIPGVNCAYRCISFHFQNGQNNYNIYRQLTCEWVKGHKEQYLIVLVRKEEKHKKI